MAGHYFNRGQFLAEQPVRRDYSVSSADTLLYPANEAPMPKPIRESKLSGLGMLIFKLLSIKPERKN